MSFVTKSNGKNNRYNPNDDILTPEPIAQFIINQLPIKETDLLYDPFKGNGALDYLIVPFGLRTQRYYNFNEQMMPNAVEQAKI